MQEEKICVDVFIPEIPRWLSVYAPKHTSGKYGSYQKIITDKKKLKKIQRLCRKHHIRCRWYEERWARSSDYRRKYLETVSPPYYCRYCWKKIPKNKLVIDHIVPVGQVQKSQWARFLLTSRGIQSVNDTRNLCTSCASCNLRKSDHMGLWVLRGWFGGKTWFRILYRILQIICIALFSILILYTVYHFAVFNNL